MCKMTSRQTNKNVSTSALSRVEKVIISELVVVTSELPKKSFVWGYFGPLHRKDDDGTQLLDNERAYCRSVTPVSHNMFEMLIHACVNRHSCCFRVFDMGHMHTRPRLVTNIHSCFKIRETIPISVGGSKIPLS